MNEAYHNIKNIKSYPDTQEVISAAASSGDTHDILIIGVSEGYHPGQEDHVDISAETGDLSEILIEMGDPYGERVELNSEDYFMDIRQRLINNLYDDDLINETEMAAFDNLKDSELCRRAARLYAKAPYAESVDSQTLIEELRAEDKASKKGYDHVVLSDVGNIFLDGELKTLKYFIARNVAAKGVVLFDEPHIEKFVAEKGKGLLRQFKRKETRAHIIAAVEEFVLAHRENYPDAAKIIEKKSRGQGRAD